MARSIVYDESQNARSSRFERGVHVHAPMSLRTGVLASDTVAWFAVNGNCLQAALSIMGLCSPSLCLQWEK